MSTCTAQHICHELFASQMLALIAYVIFVFSYLYIDEANISEWSANAAVVVLSTAGWDCVSISLLMTSFGTAGGVSGLASLTVP